jgi:hypothetical protein
VAGILHSWPPELLVAAATASAGAIGWFGRSLWHWFRSNSTWEKDEVRYLRKALDRLRRRENAYATSCELFLLVIPPELTPAQRMVVERARQLFETAVLPLDGGD